MAAKRTMTASAGKAPEFRAEWGRPEVPLTGLLRNGEKPKVESGKDGTQSVESTVQKKFFVHWHVPYG